jgi:hypothetical protein
MALAADHIRSPIIKHVAQIRENPIQVDRVLLKLLLLKNLKQWLPEWNAEGSFSPWSAMLNDLTLAGIAAAAPAENSS